ncbi:hypothetical protein WA158_007567 [Blastocystis sp. Blastoise]
MFLQTRIDRQFEYKDSTPLPICFHNRKPIYYVHTSKALQEFDLFTGSMISTIKSAVYDNKSISGLSCSFSKQGSTYIAASLETAACVIYDMNRKQYVATIPGYEDPLANIMTTTQGGINPAVFRCPYGASELTAYNLQTMEPITVDISKKVKYAPQISCVCGAFKGCYLAVGTCDSLLMFFQIGNRGYGSDVEDDDQQDEPKPTVYLEKIVDMEEGLEAKEERLRKPDLEARQITCFAWHPQMKILAMGRNDNSIVVYSCPLGAWCSQLEKCPFGDSISSIAFHPTEPLLFALVVGAHSTTKLTIWTYSPRKNMKLCETYSIDELAAGINPYDRPTLQCHPRENFIVLSFPNGRILGLSLWDKNSHLGRGVTSVTPVQIPGRTFFEGCTPESMSPVKLPLTHFFTNYELELKKNRPTPKFIVQYRGMREHWSHFLLEVPSAIKIPDDEPNEEGKKGIVAVVVRADGVKVSPDGIDVVLFLRPEASEKPREKQVNPDLIGTQYDTTLETNYCYLPKKGDDNRKFFVFLPAEKAYEVVANSKNMLRPEENQDEDEEGGSSTILDTIIYTKMPKEEPCRDALPLGDGTFLVLNQEGTSLEYRSGKLVMIEPKPKKGGDDTPTTPTAEESQPIPTIEQENKGKWDINVNIKKMIMTPFRTNTKQLPIIQYTIRNEEDIEYIVYSKNKNNEVEDDFSPDITGENGLLKLNEKETVGEITWQCIETDVPTLMAIRTNQRILMVNEQCRILTHRPSIINIGGTSRLTTSVQWLYNVIVYTCSDNRIYYMLGDGRERPLASTDIHTTEPMLLSILPDRIMYACKHREHRLTQLLSKALVPMEPLSFGSLNPAKGIKLNIAELLSRIIYIYGYKPEEEDIDGPRPQGPGYNSGMTNELVRELKKKGFGELAYAIIRSTGNNKEFPDYPQIPTSLKAELAIDLHLFEDALNELLTDNPQLQEYLRAAEEGQQYSSALPNPSSTLSQRLRSLATVAAIAGDFNTCRKCLDLCGDDWNLWKLLTLGGKKYEPFLEQVGKRAEGLRPDIHHATEAILGTVIKSKKATSSAGGALSLPSRIPTLLTNGKDFVLPNASLKQKTELTIIPAPTPLPSCFPLLAMSNIAQWVGARQPVEIREDMNAADEDGEPDDESKFDNNGTIVGDGVYYVPSDAPNDKGDGVKVKIQQAAYFGKNKEGVVSTGSIHANITEENGTLKVGYFPNETQRRYFTAELWMKKEQGEQYMPLFTRGNTDVTLWSLGVQNGILIYRTASGECKSDPEISKVNDNVWTHIAIVVDATDKSVSKVTFVIDGKVNIETDVTSPEKVTLENDGITIGGNGLYGYLTEIRLWACSRQPEDIEGGKTFALDLAENKNKMKVTIHPRNCKCDKCTKKREQQNAALRDFKQGKTKGKKDQQKEEEEIKPTVEEVKPVEEEETKKEEPVVIPTPTPTPAPAPVEEEPKKEEPVVTPTESEKSKEDDGFERRVEIVTYIDENGKEKKKKIIKKIKKSKKKALESTTSATTTTPVEEEVKPVEEVKPAEEEAKKEEEEVKPVEEEVKPVEEEPKKEEEEEKSTPVEEVKPTEEEETKKEEESTPVSESVEKEEKPAVIEEEPEFELKKEIVTFIDKDGKEKKKRVTKKVYKKKVTKLVPSDTTTPTESITESKEETEEKSIISSDITPIESIHEEDESKKEEEEEVKPAVEEEPKKEEEEEKSTPVEEETKKEEDEVKPVVEEEKSTPVEEPEFELKTEIVTFIDKDGKEKKKRVTKKIYKKKITKLVPITSLESPKLNREEDNESTTIESKSIETPIESIHEEQEEEKKEIQPTVEGQEETKKEEEEVKPTVEEEETKKEEEEVQTTVPKEEETAITSTSIPTPAPVEEEPKKEEPVVTPTESEKSKEDDGFERRVEIVTYIDENGKEKKKKIIKKIKKSKKKALESTTSATTTSPASPITTPVEEEVKKEEKEEVKSVEEAKKEEEVKPVEEEPKKEEEEPIPEPESTLIQESSSSDDEEDYTPLKPKIFSPFTMSRTVQSVSPIPTTINNNNNNNNTMKNTSMYTSMKSIPTNYTPLSSMKSEPTTQRFNLYNTTSSISPVPAFKSTIMNNNNNNNMSSLQSKLYRNEDDNQMKRFNFSSKPLYSTSNTSLGNMNASMQPSFNVRPTFGSNNGSITKPSFMHKFDDGDDDEPNTIIRSPTNLSSIASVANTTTNTSINTNNMTMNRFNTSNTFNTIPRTTPITQFSPIPTSNIISKMMDSDDEEDTKKSKISNTFQTSGIRSNIKVVVPPVTKMTSRFNKKYDNDDDDDDDLFSSNSGINHLNSRFNKYM